MTVAVRAKQKWDTRSYRRIASAHHCTGHVVVDFEDGTRVRIPTTLLVHPLLDRPDWPAVTASEYEICVPTATGPFEIPWDSIRLLTDPAFLAHRDTMATIVERQVGSRLRTLREQHGLDLLTLAARVGISPDTLERIEAGQGETTLDDLTRLLQPMGCTLNDLSDEH